MKPDAEQVADVLDRAHDVLLFKGRSKHYGDDAGPMCVLHAVSAVGCDDHLYYAAKSALDVVARERGSANVVCFNFTDDDDAVFDLFRCASKQLREEASA